MPEGERRQRREGLQVPFDHVLASASRGIQAEGSSAEWSDALAVMAQFQQDLSDGTLC